MPGKVYIADENLTKVLAKWSENLDLWVPAASGTDRGPVGIRALPPG